MADAALSTVEVLETILFQLPIKDLLLAQRVCKHWKAAIDQSTKLQQALFFKSVDPSDEREQALLYRRLADDPANQGDDAWISNMVNNPFLPAFLSQVPSETLAINPGTTLLGTRALFHPTWLVEGASWRRMLVTQPALEHSFWVRTQLPRSINAVQEREDHNNSVNAWLSVFEHHGIGLFSEWLRREPAGPASRMGDIVQRVDEQLSLVPAINHPHTHSRIRKWPREHELLEHDSQLTHLAERIRKDRSREISVYENPELLAKVESEDEHKQWELSCSPS